MKINIILEKKWIAYLGSKLYVDHSLHHLNEKVINAGKAPLSVILAFPSLLLVKDKRILLKENTQEVSLKIGFLFKKNLLLRILLSTLSFGILVSLAYHSMSVLLLSGLILMGIMSILSRLAKEVTLQEV